MDANMNAVMDTFMTTPIIVYGRVHERCHGCGHGRGHDRVHDRPRTPSIDTSMNSTTDADMYVPINASMLDHGRPWTGSWSTMVDHDRVYGRAHEHRHVCQHGHP